MTTSTNGLSSTSNSHSETKLPASPNKTDKASGTAGVSESVDKRPAEGTAPSEASAENPEGYDPNATEQAFLSEHGNGAPALLHRASTEASQKAPSELKALTDRYNLNYQKKEELEKLVKEGGENLSEAKAAKRNTALGMLGGELLGAAAMTGVGAGLGTALAALIQVLSKKTAGEEATEAGDQVDPALDPNQNPAVHDILVNMPQELQTEITQTLKSTLETLSPEEQQAFLDDFCQQYAGIAHECLGDNWASILQQGGVEDGLLGEMARVSEQNAESNITPDKRIQTDPESQADAKEKHGSALAKGAEFGAIGGAAAGVGMILALTRRRMRKTQEMKPLLDLQAKAKAGKLKPKEWIELQKREEEANAPRKNIFGGTKSPGRVNKMIQAGATKTVERRQAVEEAKAHLDMLKQDLNTKKVELLEGAEKLQAATQAEAQKAQDQKDE